MSMIRRAIPDASSVDEANEILRGMPSKSFDVVSIAYVVCLFLPLFSPTLNFRKCCNAFSSI